jgi:hypothetical protein
MSNKPLKEEEESDFMKKSRAIFARPKPKQPNLRSKALDDAEEKIKNMPIRKNKMTESSLLQRIKRVL